MEFSSKFKYEMTGPFIKAQSTYIEPTLSLTLDSDNVFSRNLIVDITGNDIEIPSIARTYYETIIRDNLNNSEKVNVEKVLLPLYTNSTNQNKKTFDSIMRTFFCNVNFNQRLLKVITTKGEVYYGGFGLVLDGEFNPLLMCTLRARKIVTRDDNGEEVVNMKYHRAICHVSPIVFTEPNRLINKGIIKKLIPLYTTTDLLISSYRQTFFQDAFENRKIEVIIDDFSKFFISPVTPTAGKCSNDTLNKCLNDNIEDILYLI